MPITARPLLRGGNSRKLRSFSGCDFSRALVIRKQDFSPTIKIIKKTNSKTHTIELFKKKSANLSRFGCPQKGFDETHNTKKQHFYLIPRKS